MVEVLLESEAMASGSGFVYRKEPGVGFIVVVYNLSELMGLITFVQDFKGTEWVEIFANTHTLLAMK